MSHQQRYVYDDPYQYPAQLRVLPSSSTVTLQLRPNRQEFSLAFLLRKTATVDDRWILATMSLMVPAQQQTHPRADMPKPAANHKLAKRASQPQLYSNNSSTIPPAVEPLMVEQQYNVETEEEYNNYEQDSLSYHGMELQMQLQDVLDSVAGLRDERNKLQGKVASLERALFAEIESAQETLCFMNSINNRLESQFIKLSQWNTVIGLGASLLGLTCVFLTQAGRN